MADRVSLSAFTTPNRDVDSRKIIISAGVWYGLFYGLSFSLFTWGYDAAILQGASAANGWVKLIIGLPLTLLIGGLVGWLSALSSSISISVILWGAAAALFGFLASHIPFEGGNLGIGLADRRLWGEVVYPFGYSAEVRTTMVIFLSTIIGIAVGFFATQAVQWAWDRTKANEKMSFGSWAVLMVCVPFAFSQAAVLNQFINLPLRQPQNVVGRLLNLIVSGDYDVNEIDANSFRSVEPFLDRLSDTFRTHFITFGNDGGTWYSGYVDVAFDNDFVLRCATSGNNVIYCDDFSQRFEGWTGDLVRAGLYGEKPWLESKVKRFSVEENALTWLKTHARQFSDNFSVSREAQYGRWVFMSVSFDTGFTMSCRFKDAAPVIVDQCVETNSTPQ